MSMPLSELRHRIDEARDRRLLDHYKALNPQLSAAVIHARPLSRRDERPEPCGGDSDMD